MLLHFPVQLSMQTAGKNAVTLILSCLPPFNFVKNKTTEARQISAQASPDPVYDSLI